MRIKIFLGIILCVIQVMAYGKDVSKTVYFKTLLGDSVARIYIYSQPSVRFTVAQDPKGLILKFDQPINGDVSNLYDSDKKFITSAKISNNGLELVLQFSDKINIDKWDVKPGGDYYSIDINYDKARAGQRDITQPHILEEQHKPEEVEELPIDQANHVELMLDETGMKQWWQFNWDKPSSVALFMLDNYVWIIFDHEAILDIDYINQQLPKPLKVTQQNMANYTILKLFYPNIMANDIKLIDNGNVWHMIIGDKTPTNLTEKERQSLDVMVEQSDARILVSGANFGEILKLSDPTSSSMLFIVPVSQPNVGIDNMYRFVDFNIMPTINGVLITTHADYINPVVTERGIEIETSGWEKASAIE